MTLPIVAHATLELAASAQRDEACAFLPSNAVAYTTSLGWLEVESMTSPAADRDNGACDGIISFRRACE